MRGAQLTWEKWDDFGTEALALAERHYAEVEAELALTRPYNPDAESMRRIAEAGIMHLLAARHAGEMVGYFTWNVLPDYESKGCLLAHQGAWYVVPGFPRVGVELLDESIRYLKSIGCSHALLHHRIYGRGNSLGKAFLRRGAVQHQIDYQLYLGE